MYVGGFIVNISCTYVHTFMTASDSPMLKYGKPILMYYISYCKTFNTKLNCLNIADFSEIDIDHHLRNDLELYIGHAIQLSISIMLLSLSVGAKPFNRK